MKTLFWLILVPLLLPLQVFANDVAENIEAIESRIQGRVGVATLNTQSGELWQYRGDERFAMMSTFKTFACANMLYLAEQGKLVPQVETKVEQRNIVEWSPVTEKLIGKHITLAQACDATMLVSDNTAANIILQHTGGPDGVTRFMRSIGDETTRLDRVEPDLNKATPGDKRDTTTPVAMARSLKTLFFDDVLSAQSTNYLKTLMQNNRISGALLRSVQPEGWHIADRTGAGENGSRGINALVWQENQPPIIIVIYITETTLSLKERNTVIAEIGEILFHQFLQP